MPRLTRRRALVAAGVLGTGGVVATARSGGFGGLLGWFGEDDSGPTLDWRPPVEQPAVEESHDALGDRVERARHLWERVDAEVEELPEVADPAGEIYLEDAEERLSELAGVEPSFDAFLELRSASYAAAAAEVALDEDDPATIVASGEQLRSDVASLTGEIDYEVDELATGLGWLYAVEKRLLAARLGTFRGGTYVGETAPPGAYGPVDVVNTSESQARAREDLRLADHWYRSHRERLADPVDVAQPLDTVRERTARRASVWPCRPTSRRGASMATGRDRTAAPASCWSG